MVGRDAWWVQCAGELRVIVSRVTTEGSMKEQLPEVSEYLSWPPWNYSHHIIKKIPITTERNQAAHTQRADPSHPNTSICQTQITISHPWIKVLSGTNGFSLNQLKLFYMQSISFVKLQYFIWNRSRMFKIHNHFTFYSAVTLPPEIITHATDIIILMDIPININVTKRFKYCP